MQNGIGRMGCLVLLVASAWVSPWGSQCAAQGKPETAALPQLDRFEASMLDKSISPCVDFYAYSCSKWKAAHPIPSDMSSVGTWTPLYLWNQMILREAMEKAAETPGAKGTEQQVGDYWKSCMNLDERTAKGMQWLADELKPVDAIKDKKEIAGVLAHLHGGIAPAFEGDDNQTSAPMFGFGPTQDLIDASKVVAGFDQGGLSLPSRDYYLKDDEDSKKLREEYRKHLVRMFGLAGDAPERAATEAAAVIEIESALAKAQMNGVDRRDPVKTYHKQSLAEIRAALPDFDMDEYLKVSGSPVPPFYIVATLEFFPALDEQIRDALAGRAEELSAVVDDQVGVEQDHAGAGAGELRLFRQRAAGGSQDAAAVAALRFFGRRAPGRGAGTGVCEDRLPAGEQGQGAGDDQQHSPGAEAGHRRGGLDDRGDQEAGD